MVTIALGEARSLRSGYISAPRASIWRLARPFVHGKRGELKPEGKENE